MSPDTAAVERDRALYLDGLEAFELGAFYESHETLEDLWLRNRSEVRPFLQGLIQLAAGYWHLERRRLAPALSLFRSGSAKLAPFAPVTLGLDVARLLLEVEACRVHAEDLGPDRLDAFDWTLRARPRVEPPSLTAFRPHRGVVPHPTRALTVAGR